MDPLPAASYPAALDAQNVAKRAKTLVYAAVRLGENLAGLAQGVGVHNLSAEKFTGLRREDLDYNGWWNFSNTEAIARHVPLSMTVDTFLDRCLSINKFLVEGLVERSLRATLHSLGVPPAEIKDLGSLKLLDCIVRLCQVAHASGLNFAAAGAGLWDRLSRDGTRPGQPIPHLFALYDMRILKAHTSERQAKLGNCLKRFGASLNQAGAGYGVIVDRVYDALIAEVTEINAKIAAAS